MKKKDKKDKHPSKKTQRKKSPSLKRDKPEKEEYPTILVVCEGKNTEPSYFNQFRVSSLTLEIYGGVGNTISLVKRTEQLSKETEYDQIWCVFDADPKPDNPSQSKNFNTAIQKATKNGFKVAYSNQAFEYWLILHFDDHQGGAMDRSDYNNKINGLLKPFKVTYDGNGCKIITPEIFEILDGIDKKTNKERKHLAILRAERNYNRFNHTNPAHEESSTTVFKLVQELLKYIS